MHEKSVRGPDGKVRKYLVHVESTPFHDFAPTGFDAYNQWLADRIKQEMKTEAKRQEENYLRSNARAAVKGKREGRSWY